MKFDIHNINGEVMFTAKIDCAEDAPRAQKLRLAVIWANRYVSLHRADLAGANLEGANLDGADLQWVRPN